MQLEVLAPAQRTVDHRLLEHHAADAARLKRLRCHVVAAQSRAAAGRGDGGREHADRRRLAGAIRTEQAEHLTVLDVEVDALDGFHAAGICLAQAAHFDTCHGSRLLLAGAGHIWCAGVVIPLTARDARM